MAAGDTTLGSGRGEELKGKLIPAPPLDGAKEKPKPTRKAAPKNAG